MQPAVAKVGSLGDYLNPQSVIFSLEDILGLATSSLLVSGDYENRFVLQFVVCLRLFADWVASVCVVRSN